jgi:hypothetical protein
MVDEGRPTDDADKVVWLKNELLDAVMRGENRAQRSTVIKLEDDGSVRAYCLQVGVDDDGNESIMLVDTNNIQWIRSYDGYLQVDPIEMPGAGANLWTPPAPFNTANDHYSVEFNIHNIDVAADYVVVTIGHAIGGAVLADPGYIMRSDTIPIRGATGWMGPYIIAGDDTIYGWAGALNEANVHWRIRRVNLEA